MCAIRTERLNGFNIRLLLAPSSTFNWDGAGERGGNVCKQVHNTDSAAKALSKATNNPFHRWPGSNKLTTKQKLKFNKRTFAFLLCYWRLKWRAFAKVLKVFFSIKSRTIWASNGMDPRNMARFELYTEPNSPPVTQCQFHERKTRNTKNGKHLELNGIRKWNWIKYSEAQIDFNVQLVLLSLGRNRFIWIRSMRNGLNKSQLEIFHR